MAFVRRYWLWILGAIVVLAVIGALTNPSTDGDAEPGRSQAAAESQEPSDDEQLAQAMCDDLEAGFSMFQMHAQAVEHYRGTGRSEDAVQLAAAEIEDLATREYCPEFRDVFEATITYETWIEPNE